MNQPADILEALLREVDAGRAAALCVIVATRGSTPQPAGAMICVDHAAQVIGTLGGGCAEARIRRQAHAMLSTRPASHAPGQRSSKPGGLITVELDHDFGKGDGMICGGRLDVAVNVVGPSSDVTPLREALHCLRCGRKGVLAVRVETTGELVEYRIPIDARPELLIAGAGHISRVLARMMIPLGFGVHVIDDRPEYANAKRFPPPIRTTVGDIAATLRSMATDANIYVVIVTRGHKHDEAALSAVLDAPVRYIGMIGSRRKIEVIYDDLRHVGAKDAQLNRVRAPVGLKLGAVTTEEIALSIAAELVSVRRSLPRGAVEGPFPISDATP